jgi:antitoxin component YwqK of YwqJK toxin-antitoxin module
LYHEKEDGFVHFDGTFVDGEPDGPNCKLFHPNGKPKYEGAICAGQKEGSGRQYHENGNLYYSGNYVANFPDSDYCEIWNMNNCLSYVGALKVGIKSGRGIGKFFSVKIRLLRRWY